MDSKVVVITGASSGIGAALALKLGSQGHKIVLAATRGKELAQVASQIKDSLVVKTDVAQRVDVERLRDEALDKYRHIDVWVNNAGRGITKSVMALTESEIDGILNVVLKSVVFGMQAVIPHFQERGQGHVINISSFLGRVPLVSYRSIYSAAKSAVNVLTANARVDLRSNYPNIHISLAMPGTVDTDFHQVAGTPTRPVAGTRLGSLVVESPDEVADKIVALIEHPRNEMYTNPIMSEIVQRYYQDVEKFESQMRPR